MILVIAPGRSVTPGPDIRKIRRSYLVARHCHANRSVTAHRLLPRTHPGPWGELLLLGGQRAGAGGESRIEGLGGNKEGEGFGWKDEGEVRLGKGGGRGSGSWGGRGNKEVVEQGG